jgi:hypothetical protein
LFELSARYEALGGTAKDSEMGEFDCVQTFRAVLMRVDGINTFGVSAGHFASFGVVSRGQLTGSIPGSSTENMLVKAIKSRGSEFTSRSPLGRICWSGWTATQFSAPTNSGHDDRRSREDLDRFVLCVAFAGPMSWMFGDPRGSETLHRRDALGQISSDGLLEFAAYQRDFDLHFHGEAQLRAVARGRQPPLRTA